MTSRVALRRLRDLEVKWVSKEQFISHSIKVGTTGLYSFAAFPILTRLHSYQTLCLNKQTKTSFKVLSKTFPFGRGAKLIFTNYSA